MNSYIGRYKHYKGAIYNVIGKAIHTETNEEMIIYKNEQNETFARPQSLFFGEVEVNGVTKPRFKKISNNQ